MIRQAISCDICGAEKRQTNHWFVAYAQAGELRVAGWKAGGRMRAGAKHLCGQTCLHKLLDEFIAGTVSTRPPAAADILEGEQTVEKFPGVASAAPIEAASVPPRSLQVLPAAVIAIAPSRPVDSSVVAPSLPPFDDLPGYQSRRWRAEAWERERERERRASLTTHRKTS